MLNYENSERLTVVENGVCFLGTCSLYTAYMLNATAKNWNLIIPKTQEMLANKLHTFIETEGSHIIYIQLYNSHFKEKH